MVRGPMFSYSGGFGLYDVDLGPRPCRVQSTGQLVPTLDCGGECPSKYVFEHEANSRPHQHWRASRSLIGLGTLVGGRLSIACCCTNIRLSVEDTRCAVTTVVDITAARALDYACDSTPRTGCGNCPIRSTWHSTSRAVPTRSAENQIYKTNPNSASRNRVSR